MPFNALDKFNDFAARLTGKPSDESPQKTTKKTKDVLYHFLSGLNEARVGGNTSILEVQYDDGSTLRCMVDPGDLFGDKHSPEHPSLTSCDSVIADMREYLDHVDENGEIKPAEKPLDAMILSHSHKDHIGAVSKMILMGYKMPQIYATPYTKQRLFQHLNNENIPPQDWPHVREIAPGGRLKFPDVEIGFFSVSHSTPQSLGLVFKTAEGSIIHTCDWKMDKTLTWGPNFDETQFKKMVGDDPTVLLMDSTGADSDKKPVTEADFRKTLTKIMGDNPDKRFVIATHPGFEENMASIAKVVAQQERNFYVDAWSHDQVFDALKKTGLRLRDHIRENIEVKSLSSAPNKREFDAAKPGDSVVLVAGVLGQKNSSLVRAVNGTSKTLQLDPKKDIILFCGPNMPGQDRENKYVLMADLKKQGFTVMGHPEYKLYPHAHARRGEIAELAELAGAKYNVPVHGDRRLRDKNEEWLQENGHKTLKPDNGQTLRLKGGKASIAEEYNRTPHYIGFETRTGSHWTDRDYIVKMTVNYTPANENDPAPPRNGRKPRIFHHRP